MVEMHLCLVTPSTHEDAPGSAAPRTASAADTWAERTFATMRRRCQRDGVWSGVSTFEEALTDPLGTGGMLWSWMSRDIGNLPTQRP